MHSPGVRHCDEQLVAGGTPTTDYHEDNLTISSHRELIIKFSTNFSHDEAPKTQLRLCQKQGNIEH